MEDGGQPAAQPLRAVGVPGRGGRLDAAGRSAAALDRPLRRIASWCRPFIPVLDGLIPRRWGISKRSHLRAVGARHPRARCSQTLLAITMLAHQAWLMVDAIVRTLGRALRHETQSPRMGDGRSRPATDADLRLRRLLLAPPLARVVAGRRRRRAPRRVTPNRALARRRAVRPALDVVARPRLADQPPAEARETQTPLHRGRRALCGSSPAEPGASSRRSWTSEDHALPPDNFQEDPEPVVAHRTSPTNLGLYLLSHDRRARLRLDRDPRDGRSGSRPRWRP